MHEVHRPRPLRSEREGQAVVADDDGRRLLLVDASDEQPDGSGRPGDDTDQAVGAACFDGIDGREARLGLRPGGDGPVGGRVGVVGRAGHGRRVVGTALVGTTGTALRSRNRHGAPGDPDAAAARPSWAATSEEPMSASRRMLCTGHRPRAGAGVRR
ncbi:hypothetical protein P9139_06050 [Curtobacterium flaccumfaciens]|nr:hypothetical protein P9139_06050 [Curtobacterium flaccumfaciens]